MATITGLTAERMREIEAASIVDGTIDSNGHLILTKYDGSSIDAGSALVAIPPGGTVQFLNSSYDYTTPSGSYPDGVSLLWIDGSTNATTWPTFAGKWGSIVTINYTSAQSNNDSTQTWTNLGGSAVTPEQWIRTGSSVGWSSWKKLALKDDVDAVDTKTTSNTNRIVALENVRLRLLNQGDLGITEASPQSAYPSGISMLSIGADSGWLINGGYGTIITFNHSGARCFQQLHDNSAGAGTTGDTPSWERVFHPDHPGWSPWRRIGDDIDVVSKVGPLASTTWHRIGTITGVSGVTPGAKAAAEFIIKTNASGQHAYIRLEVSYAFNDREAIHLHLAEYGGYVGGTWKQPFSQARILPIGGTTGTYDGAHVEVLTTSTPADFDVEMRVKHESNWNAGQKWQIVNFTPVGTVDSDFRSIGMYFTGRWTSLTLINGWLNYGTPYPWGEFKMHPGSLIEVRGLIKGGTASSFAVLPEGCRSRYTTMYATLGNGALARVDITAFGTMSRSFGTTTDHLSLDTVRFTAEW